MKKAEHGHRALMAGKLAKGTQLRSKGNSRIGVVVKIRKGVSLGTAISLSTQTVSSRKIRSQS